MRRALIPLMVVFALCACTLDHVGLSTDDDDGPATTDHRVPDGAPGPDDGPGFDAPVAPDDGGGMDVPIDDLPVDVPVDVPVTVSPDVMAPDTAPPPDVAPACGTTGQACCGAPSSSCADPAQICYPNDISASSCGPCGHLGEECCAGTRRCATGEGTCVATFAFGTATGLCLDSARASGTAGAPCTSTGGCAAYEVCLPTGSGLTCLRCGDHGGFCCPAAYPARCQSGMGTCDTAGGAALPFCR